MSLWVPVATDTYSVGVGDYLRDFFVGICTLIVAALAAARPKSRNHVEVGTPTPPSLLMTAAAAVSSARRSDSVKRILNVVSVFATSESGFRPIMKTFQVYGLFCSYVLTIEDTVATIVLSQSSVGKMLLIEMK